MGGRASLACRERELRPLPRGRSAQEEAVAMVQVGGMCSPVPARRGRRGGLRTAAATATPVGLGAAVAEGRAAGRRQRREPRLAPSGLAAGRRRQLSSAPHRLGRRGRGVAWQWQRQRPPLRGSEESKGVSVRGGLGALRNSCRGLPGAQAVPGAARRSPALGSGARTWPLAAPAAPAPSRVLSPRRSVSSALLPGDPPPQLAHAGVCVCFPARVNMRINRFFGQLRKEMSKNEDRLIILVHTYQLFTGMKV